MNDPSPRYWQIFLELFEGLPRQGPGDRSSAARALALCAELPAEPTVVDLGCGVGAQTLHLAEMTAGVITAVDNHAPFTERLARTLAEHGLSQRVHPLVADMADLELPPGSADLVWSEGALYQIGLDRALRVCHGLLRPGGYLAFTDAVWRKDNPPPDVKAAFQAGYPTMGRVADVLRTIGRAGFSLVGHFPLPDQAWWDDFYTPMKRRIALLRARYAADAEALAVLAELAQEPEMHRRHSDCYAYEFFVARRQ